MAEIEVGKMPRWCLTKLSGRDWCRLSRLVLSLFCSMLRIAGSTSMIFTTVCGGRDNIHLGL